MANDQATLLDIDISHVSTRRERDRALHSTGLCGRCTPDWQVRPWRSAGLGRLPGRPPGGNVIALVGATLLLGLLVFAWVSSFVGASFDPHGYLLILGFVGGVLLLAMLFMLVYTALALRRYGRSGFVGQMVLGTIIGLFGAAIPFTQGGWIFITLGVLFVAPALAGILMTANETATLRRVAHAPSPASVPGDRRKGPARTSRACR